MFYTNRRELPASVAHFSGTLNSEKSHTTSEALCSAAKDAMAEGGSARHVMKR